MDPRENVFWILVALVPLVVSHEDYGIPNAHISDSELVSASVICRHGDRNIIYSYKTDPWKSEENWPGGYGELTRAGKQNHYYLGQYFRQRYASIIANGIFPGNIVKVKSTDVDRVLMSAGANLAGMFPPAEDQKWTEDFDWQPIAVHTTTTKEDYLLASSKRCDRFDYLSADFMNNSDYYRLFDEYEPLIKYLEMNSGEDLSTLLQLALLHDTLFIEKSIGKCLPPWADIVLEPLGDLNKLAAYWYEIPTVTKEMQKLKSGFLLKEILNQFTDKMESKFPINQTLFMYFAHDVTIANMLHSLGLFEPPFTPEFAACLLFELHTSKETPYVQVFFKPSPHTDTQILNIPECGYNCTLADMYRLYDDILPKQSFEAECKLREGEYLPPGGNPESYASKI